MEQCLITEPRVSFKYLLKEANKDNLEQFLQDFGNNKLKPIIKSEKRTKDDKFVEHPDVYKIVAGNF
jgi:hypothetical protein